MSASDVMLQELRGNDKFDECSTRLDWLADMLLARMHAQPALPPAIVQDLLDRGWIDPPEDWNAVLTEIREMQAWLDEHRIFVQKVLAAM